MELYSSVCYQLADFGMSHDMDEDYYYKPKGGMIPVKWTAPESIMHGKYTTKSDVWSYGMVMYEIWSLGHKPFEEWDTSQVRIVGVVMHTCSWLSGCQASVQEVCMMCVLCCVSQVVHAFSDPGGYCQPPPPGCPRAVYAVMVQCW